MRYDDIYLMDEIKSLSFHIMFYRLYRVANYIVSGNTFSSFEWLRALYEKTQFNSVLDPDFGLKGEAFQYSFMLIITWMS